MQRRLWVSGFLGGALLGILTLGITDAPTKVPAKASEADSRPILQEPASNLPLPGTDRSDGRPTFEELASAVAQSQGGKISIRQMQEIARITSASPADFESYVSPTEIGPGLARSQRMGSQDTYSIDRTVMASDLDKSASREALARYGGQDEPPSGSSNRVNARTGQPMIRVGDGFTSGGSYYVPAGPDGAVNTRTGEFTPLTNEM